MVELATRTGRTTALTGDRSGTTKNLAFLPFFLFLSTVPGPDRVWCKFFVRHGSGPAAPSAPQNSRRSGTITICMDPCCRHFVAFPGIRDNVIRRLLPLTVFVSVTFKAPTQFRPKFRGLRIEPSRHGQSYINLLLLLVDCCIFLSLSSARHSFLLLRSILESFTFLLYNSQSLVCRTDLCLL